MTFCRRTSWKQSLLTYNTFFLVRFLDLLSSKAIFPRGEIIYLIAPLAPNLYMVLSTYSFPGKQMYKSSLVQELLYCNITEISFYESNHYALSLQCFHSFGAIICWHFKVLFLQVIMSSETVAQGGKPNCSLFALYCCCQPFFLKSNAFRVNFEPKCINFT